MAIMSTGQLAANSGGLYLVSTGCGDPDNMTIRARRIIESADVVFTMRGDAGSFGDLLQGKEIHAAGHILFGSKAHQKRDEVSGIAENKPHRHEGERHAHSHPHDDGMSPEKRKESIRMIVRNSVDNGKIVAILDNGDPTIFGPQMGFVKEFADLNPVVIPGISSFNAANAALKRGVVGGMGGGRSITLTGSPRPRGKEGPVAFEGKADPADAIVFFTMRSDFSDTVDELKEHYEPETPIAIVLYAGYADKERVITGTIEDIMGKMGNEKLPFEHLIYVGRFLADTE